MFNFKKMALVSLLLLLQSTLDIFAVTRYAKVVFWGDTSSGKTYICQVLSNFCEAWNNPLRNNNELHGILGNNNGNNNFPHTTQISYKSNYLHIGRGGEVVIPNIGKTVTINMCDTVSDSAACEAIYEFIKKDTTVLVATVGINELFTQDGFIVEPLIDCIKNKMLEMRQENPRLRLILCLNVRNSDDDLRVKIVSNILSDEARKGNFVFEPFGKGEFEKYRVFESIVREIYSYGIDNLPTNDDNVRYHLEIGRPSLSLSNLFQICNTGANQNPKYVLLKN